MIVKTLTYVFLFITRLRFPKYKSIAQVIRKRYGYDTVKKLRRFEKLDLKIRKNKADIEFLTACKENGLTPKFLYFKVVGTNLRHSRTYKQCQIQLLNQEIRNKKSILSKQHKDYVTIKKVLKDILTFINYTHICCLFLVSNDKKLLKVKEIHLKKLKSLGFNSTLSKHDPEKIISNFSSYNITAAEKNLLVKGLNYSLPPKKINYADYLTPYELLYKGINDLVKDESKLERVKTNLKKTCFSSFDSYNFEKELNITKEEFECLNNLSRRQELIIQKADKGNSVVILNKLDYKNRMKGILSDTSKFKKIDITPGKELNIILQQEDRLIKFLKSIKSCIDYSLYKDLYPQGSQPGVIYGLSKIHKPLVDNVPKLRPILSAIKTSTYNWAKFFVPILRPLTFNTFTIKDSFEFAKNITDQNAELYMASLDVDSLFTNVPLDETINICVNELFQTQTSYFNLNRKQIFEMLSLTTKESIISFDGGFYSQVDGVAMGSPLGPTLANAFLCHHEQKWLDDCPLDFKPLYYKRYVDDIFLLFKKLEHAKNFADYMNSKHKNISFTFEVEKEGSFPFLDVNISRDKNKFVTSVYRKSTFSGVYTNFTSFLPLEYKFGLIYTLLFRCFTLVSDFSKFHLEVEKLKNFLSKNGYSSSFIDTCIRKFLDKRYTVKEKSFDVPKKEVTVVLPFLGSNSSIIKTQLNKTFNQYLKFCKLRIVFKTSNRLSNYFRFKDNIPGPLRSCQIYKFSCGSCNASYIGKTFRHMKVRVSEHMGVSPRTGKVVKGTLSTSVRDHMLFCDHKVTWDDFTVLGRESNHYLLDIKESLFIKRDQPLLNKNIYSKELYLF